MLVASQALNSVLPVEDLFF